MQRYKSLIAVYEYLGYFLGKYKKIRLIVMIVIVMIVIKDFEVGREKYALY